MRMGSLSDIKLQFTNYSITNSMRLCPVFGGGNSFRDRRMGMEEPLDPAGWSFFGEILLRQFVHRRNKRFDCGHGLEAVTIGLPLIETRIRIKRRHQRK